MSSEHEAGGHVAGLISAGRERTGLNQVQLAERSGVSRSRLIAAEAGYSIPSMAVCVKLARALGIELDEMVRAHTRDSLHSVDPEVLREVEGRLGGGQTHWEKIAEHHGLRIEHERIVGKVDGSGSLQLLRSYKGCYATRPRDLLVFRDRIFGERAPVFAVKGSPKGLGYSMNVSMEGEWAQHRVEVHRSWTPEDGPFDIEFENVLPQAYVLDLDEYNRRRRSEGHSATRQWYGNLRTFVTYAKEVLELKLVLPQSYEPTWREPTAVWGNAPIDDADYHELHPRTCQSFTFRTAKNEARLVVKRPEPGYTFGIQWTPVAWHPDEEKGK